MNVDCFATSLLPQSPPKFPLSPYQAPRSFRFGCQMYALSCKFTCKIVHTLDNLFIKNIPACNQTRIHLPPITSCPTACVPCNVGKTSSLTEITFIKSNSFCQKLKSDIPYDATSVELAPSSTRFDLPVKCTVSFIAYFFNPSYYKGVAQGLSIFFLALTCSLSLFEILRIWCCIWVKKIS